jgi:hypothetical protein
MVGRVTPACTELRRAGCARHCVRTEAAGPNLSDRLPMRVRLPACQVAIKSHLWSKLFAAASPLCVIRGPLLGFQKICAIVAGFRRRFRFTG